MLKLSDNEFDDAGIKFMSKSMQQLTNLTVFEFELQNTTVKEEGWAMLVQSVEKLFKLRLQHGRISYNRFDRKEGINTKLKSLLRMDPNIKMDLLFVNNDYFSLYLRKKPLQVIKTPKVPNQLFRPKHSVIGFSLILPLLFTISAWAVLPNAK